MLVYFLFIKCPRPDLNRYDLVGHEILSLECLPFHHLGSKNVTYIQVVKANFLSILQIDAFTISPILRFAGNSGFEPEENVCFNSGGYKSRIQKTTSGFEPENGSFADSSLTAWLRRRKGERYAGELISHLYIYKRK